jgi:hypothetical protein
MPSLSLRCDRPRRASRVAPDRRLAPSSLAVPRRRGCSPPRRRRPPANSRRPAGRLRTGPPVAPHRHTAGARDRTVPRGRRPTRAARPAVRPVRAPGRLGAGSRPCREHPARVTARGPGRLPTRGGPGARPPGDLHRGRAPSRGRVRVPGRAPAVEAASSGGMPRSLRSSSSCSSASVSPHSCRTSRARRPGGRRRSPRARWDPARPCRGRRRPGLRPRGPGCRCRRPRWSRRTPSR